MWNRLYVVDGLFDAFFANSNHQREKTCVQGKFANFKRSNLDNVRSIFFNVENVKGVVHKCRHEILWKILWVCLTNFVHQSDIFNEVLISQIKITLLLKMQWKQHHNCMWRLFANIIWCAKKSKLEGEGSGYYLGIGCGKV